VIDGTTGKDCAPLRSSPLGVAPSALGCVMLLLLFIIDTLKKPVLAAEQLWLQKTGAGNAFL